MFTRLLTVVVSFAALALLGCGPSKLNESKSWELDSGDARALDLPAVSKAQKVNIEFSSSEGEISVYVFKEEDAKGDDGLFGSDSKKALAFKKAKSDTFSADVPENTATRVIVRGIDKKTKVTLKVTN
jgi:hypothetical protein